jgi:hypothetical protein
MTELSMTAKAREHRGQVDIYFDAYGSHNAEKNSYQLGDLLLTLKRKHNSFCISGGILQPESDGSPTIASAERLRATCSQASLPHN